MAKTDTTSSRRNFLKNTIAMIGVVSLPMVNGSTAALATVCHREASNDDNADDLTCCRPGTSPTNNFTRIQFECHIAWC